MRLWPVQRNFIVGLAAAGIRGGFRAAWLIAMFMAEADLMAAGVPRTCQVKSQEVKLARECFSGDMHDSNDLGMFLGTDETSKEDMNYCYNAFVLLQPQKGSEVQVTVFKDNPKGQLRIYNYSAQVQALVPPKTSGGGRAPASKMPPPAVSFKNLSAECFAHKEETNKCSKGLFGLGNTDLPMTVELVRTKNGFKIKGATRDQNLIQHATEPARALVPKSEGDLAKTDQWLLQVIKQRLLSTAQRQLAMIRQRRLNHKNLGSATTQFRYCRMALDGFIHQKKYSDPFNADERKILDNLEDQLKSTAPAVR